MKHTRHTLDTSYREYVRVSPRNELSRVEEKDARGERKRERDRERERKERKPNVSRSRRMKIACQVCGLRYRTLRNCGSAFAFCSDDVYAKKNAKEREGGPRGEKGGNKSTSASREERGREREGRREKDRRRGSGRERGGEQGEKAIAKG